MQDFANTRTKLVERAHLIGEIPADVDADAVVAVVDPSHGFPFSIQFMAKI